MGLRGIAVFADSPNTFTEVQTFNEDVKFKKKIIVVNQGSGSDYIIESNSSLQKANFTGISVFSGKMSIDGTNKFEFGGDGSNTSIREMSADLLAFEAGGVDTLKIGSANVTLRATGKFYLDGGGDSFIQEVSANNVIHVVGNNTVLQMDNANIFAQMKLTMADGKDIEFKTTTGSKIGTAANQKISRWGVTPVVQPAHIIDADGTLADITTKFNTLLAQHATTGEQASS